MKNQLKLVLLLSALIMSQIINAQKIYDSETDEEFEKIQRKGASIVLELEKDEVADNWEKFLKKYGKFDSKKETFTQDAALIPELSATAVKTYSKVYKDANGIKVWWCVDLGTQLLSSSDASRFATQQKLLHTFGTDLYKSILSKKVAETQKSFDKATKTQMNLSKESVNLSKEQSKIEKNKSSLAEKMKDLEKESIKTKSKLDENSKKLSEANDELNKSRSELESIKSKFSGIQ